MSVLQNLLNRGLVNVGSDDSRLEKMENASKALANRLMDTPDEVIPATLVALDNAAEETEPIFATVEQLVISEWKTLRNTHVNRPRELLRSIIIDALSQVVENKAEVAGAVWHTAASPFNHNQARLGKEDEVLVSLLHRAAEITEREALSRAGVLSQKAVQPEHIDDGEQICFTLPEYEELQEEDEEGGAASVNAGLARLSESLTSGMEEYSNNLEQRFSELMEVIRAALSGPSQADRMRLDVLWWIEAKYSPSLRVGYRQLPQTAAVLAMVHDLAQIVPALAPASVTYVLGETVASLSSSVQHSLESILSTLNKEGASVKKLFQDWAILEGRVPLLQLTVEAAVGNKVGADDLRQRAGVSPTLEVTMQDFAMWLFRDMQAKRLVEGSK